MLDGFGGCSSSELELVLSELDDPDDEVSWSLFACLILVRGACSPSESKLVLPELEDPDEDVSSVSESLPEEKLESVLAASSAAS